MTVRKLTDRLWYAQEIAIYNEVDADDLVLDHDNKLAIYNGANYLLDSPILMEKKVVNYGVINNKFIITIK